VHRHIRASTACFAVDLSFKEIHVDAGEAMSWLGREALLVLHLTYVTNLQVKL
jgi:hypothetical protein